MKRIKLAQEEKKTLNRLEKELRESKITRLPFVIRNQLWDIARRLPVIEITLGIEYGAVLGKDVNDKELYKEVPDDELVTVPFADRRKIYAEQHYLNLRKSYHDATEKGKGKAIQAYVDFVKENEKNAHTNTI